MGNHATLALGFGLVLGAGLLLTSALRGRSLSEVAHGVTSSTYQNSAFSSSGSSSSGTAEGSLAVPEGKGGVIERAATVLQANGYNNVGAAGVIGNAYQESSWNPAATGDGGGGLWGFTAAPQSLADLQSYAASQGKPWTDIETQTAFLVSHVPSSVREAVNAASSPQEAARIFMEQWERPLVATENLPKREEGAAIAAGHIKAPAPSSVRVTHHRGSLHMPGFSQRRAEALGITPRRHH